MTPALTAVSAPHLRGCSHSGETAEVACERGFRGVECLFRARGGTRGEPDSRFALRQRLFLGSVTQCVAWLWSRTASLPLPPPPPHRPSFKTKLGPSQTLHALFLSLLHSPLFYLLGRSVLFSLYVSYYSHLPLLFFASFNKALVRNPHTDVPPHFPYKHTYNPTRRVNFPHPHPPPSLCGVHVCHLVTVCGLHIKPAA